MNRGDRLRGRIHGRLLAGLFAAALVTTLPFAAWGFTLSVEDGNGVPVTVPYRWLLEEDTTHPVTPGVPDNNSLAVSIHRSYAPVAAKGTSADLSPLGDPSVVDPSKRYVLSVLPTEGYSIGGANVSAGQDSVRVTVLKLPLPTAQISVLVFEDIQPINSAPDLPVEPGLPGWSVFLFDQAGQDAVDAFGNNLGTTYQQDCDGNGQNPGTGASFCLDVDGAPIVTQLGSGIVSGPDGRVLIKNIAPGKYGVRIVPPLDNNVWSQTSTIEGTPGIDAWVKSNEPPYFIEAGFFFDHVFFGFVRPTDNAAWRPLGPVNPPFDNTAEQSGTITGQVVAQRTTRQQDGGQFFPGNPISEAWVALTNLNNVDEMIYAQPCDAQGNFSIANVPPGRYQLAFWDVAKDVIIAFRTAVVPPAGGTVDMGQVTVPLWFGTFRGTVFNDVDRNGFRDPGEGGIAGQAVNLRFRDGSIYQSTASTPPDGEYELTEVFPFFKWLVAEVDFATLDATGATVWVDAGGELPVNRTPPVPVDPADPNTRQNDELNPQPQPENGGNLYRTEASEPGAPVLTEGMIVYADQTNVIDWGKANYPPGMNGGISGLVFYATTRAENSPAIAAGEPWEPGIPRVPVNLYADANADGVIDDANGDGAVTRADVDNHPFENFPGPEDVDRNGNGSFDGGDAINIVSTDSWDDNLPTGCVNPNDNTATPIAPYIDCAEIIPYWNQVRPALFDGGYGFFSYFPGGVDSGGVEVVGLPTGTYIVEIVPPPGYELLKEEDKNVDFGDAYVPGTLALETPFPSTVPPCVGDPHELPEFLTLFPGVPNPSNEPFAPGLTAPLCDRKQVRVEPGLNAAADFFLFTEVPKAGRFVGLVTNDITNTFDPDNPRFGDKLSPMWLPVAFEDSQGNEIARVYTDQYGGYNALLPSTYTVNVPSPTGVAPGMVTVALNSPGPVEIPPGSGQFMTDPFYNPGYSVFRLTFDLWPGKTTILDTPVLPIAAFTASLGLLDCEFPDGTPVISQVDGPGGGPFVDRTGRIVRITSVGAVGFAGVTRNYGFGDVPGTVTVGGIPLSVIAWTDAAVTARVTEGIATGQLMLARGDNGATSPMGITLHVGGVPHRVYPGQSIQTAINNADGGDIILVAPGIYHENIIMWKPVKLQGNGAWSTALNGSLFSPEKEQAWLDLANGLIDSGAVDLVPGQVPGFQGGEGARDIGAIVSVYAKDGEFAEADPARIDGFLLTGATRGGAIFANGFAHHLRITNNKIQSNQGNIVGGIRIGTQSILAGTGTFGPTYQSSFNDNVNILHNHIDQNGGIGEPAAGGGIGLFNGSDDYRIAENRICGNFSLVYGAGITHFGLSGNGRIENNEILLNESFDEGAGIMVSGELVPTGADQNIVTPGTGNVVIDRNRIQGNMAGDDGGGIRTLLANGQDIANNPTNPDAWHRIDIINNVIVNNVSADSGAGIALNDTANARILHNTIAHNDSTGTGVDAFGAACELLPAAAGLCDPAAPGGNPNLSVPQVAGIHSLTHSLRLRQAFGPGFEQTYPNPLLYNNILWHNRSFYWDGTANAGQGGLLPAADNAFFWNLAVTGGAGTELMDPNSGVLDNNVEGIYNATNLFVDPLFAAPYFNSLQAIAGPANFTTITFTPLAPTGDYHIQGPIPGDNTSLTSPAIDAGSSFLAGWPAQTELDFDGEVRPFDEQTVPDLVSPNDIGADEFHPPPEMMP